ncbi:hypothetical protein ACJX0J_037014, partial [Zea mays]
MHLAELTTTYSNFLLFDFILILFLFIVMTSKLPSRQGILTNIKSIKLFNRLNIERIVVQTVVDTNSSRVSVKFTFGQFLYKKHTLFTCLNYLRCQVAMFLKIVGQHHTNAAVGFSVQFILSKMTLPSC